MIETQVGAPYEFRQVLLHKEKVLAAEQLLSELEEEQRLVRYGHILGWPFFMFSPQLRNPPPFGVHTVSAGPGARIGIRLWLCLIGNRVLSISRPLKISMFWVKTNRNASLHHMFMDQQI